MQRVLSAQRAEPFEAREDASYLGARLPRRTQSVEVLEELIKLVLRLFLHGL
jgi:hypothetical protein